MGNTHDEQVVGEDNRLLKVETEGLDQGVLGTLSESNLLLHDLSLRLEVLIAGQCSKSGSSSVEDVFRRSL